MELEHVGVAVRDAEAALALMEALLGTRPYKSQVVESEGVRTHFLRAGRAKLELLEALNDESPVARYLEKRGPGLHHLAFEVKDLEAVRDRLAKAGFTVLGSPRPGADGKDVFFLHPRDTGGVLYEFCRQNRSVLADSTVTSAGKHLTVRRAGTRGPVSFILGEIPVQIEILAGRLEQSTQVVVSDEVSAILDALALNDVHLILPSGLLGTVQAQDPRIRSLVVVVDVPTDVFIADRPTLIVARPSAASAATALYERWPDSELAIGGDDLLVFAIETHVRRIGWT